MLHALNAQTLTILHVTGFGLQFNSSISVAVGQPPTMHLLYMAPVTISNCHYSKGQHVQAWEKGKSQSRIMHQVPQPTKAVKTINGSFISTDAYVLELNT